MKNRKFKIPTWFINEELDHKVCIEYDGETKFPSFESEFRFNKNELITDQFEIRHYVRS